MKIVFKIFTVQEMWFKEDGGSDWDTKMVTMLIDWGHEFESEEQALSLLNTLKDEHPERPLEDIVIQKVITI